VNTDLDGSKVMILIRQKRSGQPKK